MKSLSELADTHEKWATATEAAAEEILSRLDSLSSDVQQQQLWRLDRVLRFVAGRAMAEAAARKKRAAELRKLEGDGIPEELHPASGTPDDRIVIKVAIAHELFGVPSES
jgi:hypothetical protein